MSNENTNTPSNYSINKPQVRPDNLQKSLDKPSVRPTSETTKPPNQK